MGKAFIGGVIFFGAVCAIAKFEGPSITANLRRKLLEKLDGVVEAKDAYLKCVEEKEDIGDCRALYNEFVGLYSACGGHASRLKIPRPPPPQEDGDGERKL